MHRRLGHVRLAPQAFDLLVQEALDALPPSVQDQLATVAVVVEAEPPTDKQKIALT